MADIGCSIVSPPHNPYEQRKIRETVRNEIRERELEKKWQNDNITKFEAAELATRKISKFLNSDTFIKH